MNLLAVHKVLIGMGLALSIILIAWGAQHWFIRHEPDSWIVFAIGVTALLGGTLYMRKLLRNPPI